MVRRETDGEEITFYFDWEEYRCCSCGKRMHIYGDICEYPIGAYSYGKISFDEVEGVE